ncbi:MAG: hypothetical protein EXR17_04630, partial [Flavobacteriaceae bacterium]|nr:hypothetical protein [Flavobacteriaceae bacterium]
MKKQFLLSVTVLSAVLATAQVSLSSVTANQGRAETITNSNIVIDKSDNGGFGVSHKTKKLLTARGANYKDFIRIGSTYYDLQSNGAMPHRLAIHANGGMSAVWTTSTS